MSQLKFFLFFLIISTTKLYPIKSLALDVEGLHLEAGYGQNTFEIDNINLQNDSTRLARALQKSRDQTETQTWALGWRANPIALLRLGYMDWGDQLDKQRDLNDAVFNDSFDIDTQADVESWFVSLTGIAPLSDSVNLMGGAGFSHWNASYRQNIRTESQAAPLINARLNDKGNDPIYHLGLQLEVSRHLALNLSYQYLAFRFKAKETTGEEIKYDYKLSDISLSLSYEFR